VVAEDELNMKKVLITGGSGMIGLKLSEMLLEKGYKVIWLSRERYIKAEIPRYRWDYRKGEIDIEALEQADVVVHLAGSNLGDDSWTRRKKQKIVESRVLTTKLLLDTYKSLNKKPDAFISASAVGYYGMHSDDNIYNEEDQPARNDFLSRTCKKWESATFQFQEELGVRTVALRTSFVISKESEAFKKMVLPTRFGLGAPMGSGKQYMSWIHLNDLCNLYIKSIEDDMMSGIYNAAAPQHTTNKELMRSIAKELKRPFIIPRIPSFLMKLIMGESAGMVLEGSRVSSQKAIDSGFKFQYPSIKEAIQVSLN
jgi:uncharacterized protein (TIGR01777 family)